MATTSRQPLLHQDSSIPYYLLVSYLPSFHEHQVPSQDHIGEAVPVMIDELEYTISCLGQRWIHGSPSGPHQPCNLNNLYEEYGYRQVAVRGLHSKAL